MLQSFLTQRTQKFHVSGCLSDVTKIKQGVPQCTVLGPLFFNFYVSDLDKQLENNCEMIHSADNTLIYCSTSGLNFGNTNLEFDLIRLLNFFKSHKLTLNKDNTEFVIFAKSQMKANQEIQTVEIADSRI